MEGDEAPQTQHEDPLIGALPPETDYITYLTLLEYHLTSANLSTLTNLLTADDGTLAKEIGWDLLKLVLPLAGDAPEEAERCLQAAARRGNPREVVVRVAEEFEKLRGSNGEDGSDADQGFEGEASEDKLPTFPGEAQRIHLGDLTLEGMPPPATSGIGTSDSLDNGNPDSRPALKHEDDLLLVKFRILLSMLGILHPRIQTKFPSRFLATTLPAALGAYRKLRNNADTTAAFLNSLSKISGRQRPALPPRTSSSTIPSADAVTSSTIFTAPLPDPEAKEGDVLISSASAEEQAIVQRLLQAVLCEILEEYMLSLASQDPPHMSWTRRLREKYQPSQVVPHKRTEVEGWRTKPALQEREAVMASFLHLSQDLGLDHGLAKKYLLPQETSTTGDDTAKEAEADLLSEYPTSPDQIPFSETGLLYLLAARNFTAITSTLTGSQTHNYIRTFSCLSNLCTKFAMAGTLPAIDALLSLFYTSLYEPTSIPTDDPASQVSLSNEKANSQQSDLVLTLLNLCLQIPDPELRDSSHRIAARLFHNLATPQEKISTLTILFTKSLTPSPQLRAVAITWLKNELLAVTSVAAGATPQVGAIDTDPSIQNPHSSNTLLHDFKLLKLLFEDTPSLALAGDAEDVPKSSESGDFLAGLPSQTATLNLAYALLSNAQLRANIASSGGSGAPEAPLSTAKSWIVHVEALRESQAVKDAIAELLQPGEGVETDVAAVGEISAFDDALGRAKEGLAASVGLSP